MTVCWIVNRWRGQFSLTKVLHNTSRNKKLKKKLSKFQLTRVECKQRKKGCFTCMFICTHPNKRKVYPDGFGPFYSRKVVFDSKHKVPEKLMLFEYKSFLLVDYVSNNCAKKIKCLLDLRKQMSLL